MTGARAEPGFPLAARWVCVAVLGGLGAIGVLRGVSAAPRHAEPLAQPIAVTLPASPPPSGAALSAAQPSTSIVATEPAATVPADAPPAPAPTEVGVQKLIAVNTASAAELELLPGVGPVMAQRIIDDRAANGPFRSPADLDRVKGIGPKTLEKLTPLVRFD